MGFNAELASTFCSGLKEPTAGLYKLVGKKNPTLNFVLNKQNGKGNPAQPRCFYFFKEFLKKLLIIPEFQIKTPPFPLAKKIPPENFPRKFEKEPKFKRSLAKFNPSRVFPKFTYRIDGVGKSFFSRFLFFPPTQS